MRGTHPVLVRANNGHAYHFEACSGLVRKLVAAQAKEVQETFGNLTAFVKKEEEDDAEVYSDPDEGVEIVDMDEVKTMDWMAPDSLRRERQSAKKKKKKEDVTVKKEEGEEKFLKGVRICRECRPILL